MPRSIYIINQKTATANQAAGGLAADGLSKTKNNKIQTV